MSVSVQLYPPQQAAINAILLAMRAGRQCGLIVLPTGVGKTIMVMSLGQRLGVPMLFLVHRKEQIGQTIRAAGRAWPDAVVASIEDGTSPHWDVPRLDSGRRPDLVVAMVQTLANRIQSIAPDRFGIVVVDECHHSPAAQWMRVIRHFTPGFLLGITATPQRHDGRGLAEQYGREPLYSYPLFRAIEDGFLVPLKIHPVQTATDLDQVASGGEDFVAPQLARAVDTVNRNKLVVEAYRKHGENRLAVCFAVDIPHARHLTQAFLDAGVPAGCVTGSSTPAGKRERTEVLAALAAGTIRVVCNVEVLTEAFDLPALSCILWARPTESRAFLIQGVGRGLRLAPGKKDCLVLDFVDVSSKHKLVSPLDLLGKNKKPADPKDPSPRLPAANPTPPPEGAAIVSWNIMNACPWPELPSLDGYVPTQEWHDEPASQGQLRYLSRYGLTVSGSITRGEASYLLDRAAEYEAAFPAPATPRQRAYLIRHGMWEKGMSKRLASQLIDNHQEALRQEAMANG